MPANRSSGDNTRSSSPVLLLVLLFGAGGVLLLCCAGAGLGLFLALRERPTTSGPSTDKGSGTDKGGGGGAVMTQEIWGKLDMLMKKEDIAKLCGEGKSATDADVVAGLQRAKYNQVTATQQTDNARAVGGRSWQAYFGGDEMLFVAYAPSSRGDRAVYAVWVSVKANNGQGGFNSKRQFWTGAGDISAQLEQAVQRRDQDDAILNDKKWKTGNDARTALLGSWKHAMGSKKFEFKNDGNVTETTLTGSGTAAYQLTDPQQLQIGQVHYRVLVAADEMYLVQNERMLIGPFRRQ
jgi:hypothetical protein